MPKAPSESLYHEKQSNIRMINKKEDGLRYQRSTEQISRIGTER